MATSTTLVLVAGRFGLAPTVNRPATKGLKLYEDRSAGIMSNDPAGMWSNHREVHSPLYQASPRWMCWHWAHSATSSVLA